jgi:hypothetical protein
MAEETLSSVPCEIRIDAEGLRSWFHMRAFQNVGAWITSFANLAKAFEKLRYDDAFSMMV